MSTMIPPPPPKHLSKRNAMLAKRKNFPIRVPVKTKRDTTPLVADVSADLVRHENAVLRVVAHDGTNYHAATGVLGMMSDGQAWYKLRREERKIEQVGCTTKMNSDGKGVPDWQWRKLGEQDPTRPGLSN